MNKECLIIITNYSNKEYILKEISKNHLLYNLKFYTFEELKKKIFFDYDNKTIEYVMNTYGVSLNIAKMYIQNLYFLKPSSSKKISFLNELKEELDKKDLLIKDNQINKYLRNHKIIVYGYDYLTKEQEMILEGLPYKVKNKDFNEHTPTIWEAKDINKEVLFVVNDISKKINKGLKIENIKLIATKEYQKALRKYSNIFNLPISLKSENSFYSTKLAQEFLNRYDELSIEDNVSLLSEYEGINNLIRVINKSANIENKDFRKDFIISNLKEEKIKNDKYDKCISIANITNIFSTEDNVYLLGFNLNSYPKIIRDDAYLTDKELNELGLDTSFDKNKQEKETILNAIKRIPNLTITYKLKGDNGKCYPSILLKELNAEVNPCKIDTCISYSKLNTSLEYAKSLDDFYKYRMIDEHLNLYSNSLNIKYRTYNHEFSGISLAALKESLNNRLKLSYTSLEKYHECAFKYYLSYILKVDDFEETFKTLIGSITHHILEIGLKKDINVRVEVAEYIRERGYQLNSREFFYLEKLSDELENILAILKKQNKNSKLNEYLFEIPLSIPLEEKDMDITLEGKIDKVMLGSIDNDNIIAVVDYKTGNTKITLKNLEFGLNIQLPIYLYLLKKSNRFENAIIGGFYIQKVLDEVPKVDPKKSLSEIREEQLKLQGYSINREKILKYLDCNYKDNSYIKGIEINKDGSFSKKANVLSDMEMNELIVKVEEKLIDSKNKILNSEFQINPKVMNKKNISCEYCKFKDICYHTKEDEVILDGIE